MIQQAPVWTYRVFSGIVLACAAASCFFLYMSLQKNIGVTPDSVEYLYAAQSFKNGEGFKSIHCSATQQGWLTHFPPGLSILYGTVSKGSCINDILDAAAACNVIFFILNGSLVYLLTLYGSKNKWIALAAGLFVFTSIDGFCISQMLWSEPCFFFFTLLSLYALCSYIKSGSMRSLLAAAGLIAVACIIRYAGIALIISGCIVTISQKHHTLSKNVKRSICLGIISSSLLVLWFARNYLLQKTASGRRLAFHPMTHDYLHDFLHAIKSFYLQINTDQATGCIGSILACILLFAIYRLYIGDRSFLKSNPLAYVLLLFGVVYILFIFTSNTFLDFTPLYYRILYLPFLCFLLTFITYLSLRVGQAGFASATNKGLSALCTLFAVLHLVGFKNFINASPEPDGYLTASWRNSETAAYVKKIPAEAIVYSPDAEPIYMITGRAVASVEYIERDYSRNKARRQFIVYFKSGRISNGYCYDNPKAEKFEKIRLIREFADGKVYELF